MACQSSCDPHHVHDAVCIPKRSLHLLARGRKIKKKLQVGEMEKNKKFNYLKE